MDDIKRALLGDKEAAKRMTDAGVLLPCAHCRGVVFWIQTIAWVYFGFYVLVVECKQRHLLQKRKPASLGTPARRF